MGRWSALVAAVALALTFAACGEETIDADQLEDAIASEAESDLEGSDLTVSSVTCPDDIKSETGEPFECTLELSDGLSATAKGEVTDGDAGDVEYRISLE
jgi:hypothetical protein